MVVKLPGQPVVTRPPPITPEAATDPPYPSPLTTQVLARDIVEEARDHSARFDRKFGGEKSVRRALNRIQERAVSKVIAQYPDPLAVHHTVTRPQIQFALDLERDIDKVRETVDVDDKLIEVDLDELAISVTPHRATRVPAFAQILTNVLVGLPDGRQLKTRLTTLDEQYNRAATFPSIAVGRQKDLIWLSDLRFVTDGDISGWEDWGAIAYQYVPLPEPILDLDDPITAPGLAARADGSHDGVVDGDARQPLPTRERARQAARQRTRGTTGTSPG